MRSDTTTRVFTMIFSLILATYGRSEEIEDLFESLVQQSIGTENFEIIVVDQNETIDLSALVDNYSKKLNIRHIRSLKKGLSLNRNIGIDIAKGKYICFPDDDCTYYPDTLQTAYFHLRKPNTNAVFGAIRHRPSGENIIRDWPSSETELTRLNFFDLFSSITIFTSKNNFRFNEKLGVGCYFGACEDNDYTYNLVKELRGCFYYSDLEVWHPKIQLKDTPKEKNISYGLGWGAFFAIHKFDIFIVRLFIPALAYHILLAAVSVVRGDMVSASRRFDSFTSRVRGFFEYTFTRN